MADNVIELKRAITPKRPLEFIPYCKHSLDEREIQEVVEVLKSDWLTTGPRTIAFEKQFCDYVGSQFGVAVNSCTAALHLALVASDIKSGDEVITSPMTFCATAEVIEYQHAKPVFVDINPGDFNINANLIANSITSRTRALMPVHYGGIPCDMVKIKGLSEEHNLTLVEDAAHASGSVYRDQKIGGMGNLAAFSFYPTKNMTTGEGGIITTNDEALADKLRVLSLHGISKDAWKRYSSQGQWYYEVACPGYKYNMTDIQAALGLHQLQKLDDFNVKRTELARYYYEALRDIPGIDMPEWYKLAFEGLRESGTESSWHLFVIMLDLKQLSISRNHFIERLKEFGIGTSVHFIPLHLQPFYAKKYNLKPGDFPVAEAIYKRIVSIPLYPKLEFPQLDYIIDRISTLAKQHRR